MDSLLTIDGVFVGLFAQMVLCRSSNKAPDGSFNNGERRFLRSLFSL